MSKKIIILIVLVVSLGITGFKFFNQSTKQEQTAPAQPQSLRVISTKPDPLEGATIAATQDIEIKFSKPVFVGQLKIKFDPVLDYNIETVNQIKANTSDSFKITFKEPLALGSGFSLMIQGDTQTEDGQRIDKEYIYHFKTVRYKGV